MINKRQLLAERPNGMPNENTWNFVEETVAALQDGEILIEQSHVSLDPAMRGWINDSRSYIPPVQIGEVMRAGSVGKVIDTQGETKFKVGDYVTGWGGVQQYYVGNGDGFVQIEPNPDNHPKYLGVLGMPGMTAYFGILEVGEIKEGDVVLLSGGAGAVGSVVGQIAKIKGCTVIGIAGGPEKCAVLVNEVGTDAAIDYKNQNIDEQIKIHAPDGIDIFFDNVGGNILDLALDNLRDRARVIICGAISQYSHHDAVEGPSLYLRLAEKYARMEGFTVMHFEEHYERAYKELLELYRVGKLKVPFHIEEGIDNFPLALQKLFTGGNTGKLMVKI